MKISLNWIFDHINGNASRVDIPTFVDLFIQTTAEVEAWHEVSVHLSSFTVVEVAQITAEAVVAHSKEWNKTYTLAHRSDVSVGSLYLIVCHNDTLSWAKMSCVGGSKEILLPALSVHESLLSGEWKQSIDAKDVILEIDNKSINHRPDLWGHKGLAREVAAMLDLSLVDACITHNNKDCAEPSLSSSTAGNFSITVDSSDACPRFSMMHIDIEKNKPSDIYMAFRLSRLDIKPIDVVVDATNYVMLDMGQPMHAFDAATLNHSISVRYAHDKERLTLLDGESLSLMHKDIVIASGGTAISLAGVMGGASTGVNAHSTSLLLESASFDAAVIRRSAARYKKRTEASMRFEKNLDPNHIEDALYSFVSLLKKHGVSVTKQSECALLGKKNPKKKITVTHDRIERSLGLPLSLEKIQKILTALSFDIEVSDQPNGIEYTIGVPSFRATKDIAIAEDIIEEIGRYVGYNSIPYVMPQARLVPSDLHKTYTVRKIKGLLSGGLLMRELYDYSFFDEPFLRSLKWQPESFVEIKNPISEHYTRLVTTLQPHLLKAIQENSIHSSQLRFYEWGRTWHQEGGDIVEKKSLCGIFFDTNKSTDFYQGKQLLSRLFTELYCDVEWNKASENNFSWLSTHQTASIIHHNNVIGYAGMVDNRIVEELSPSGGNAFIFELDGDFLINYKRPLTRFVPLSKYPSVYRDISIMVPAQYSVDEYIRLIQSVDNRVKQVTLIDFFEKKEWKDQKSLTFHIEIHDHTKTLNNEEIEVLWNALVNCLQHKGAEIR